jgi:hypothetical protein
MLHSVSSFIQLLGTMVSEAQASDHVTDDGPCARSESLTRKTFCFGCRVRLPQSAASDLRDRDNHGFWFFGGHIRGQEESWSNEEGSYEEEGR